MTEPYAREPLPLRPEEAPEPKLVSRRLEDLLTQATGTVFTQMIASATAEDRPEMSRA